ncbi:pre-mRNA-processing factor 40 [Paragonimus westermani]|uniref:Pre-mRNA-processing factor 40 n=1 Tax=Paragonimus westermani TaxID=34504 RepID=A0A5J4NLI5_9TREM|nr:pre-mRNA-processing factor 40 [Paragonimus westermani]
MAGYHSYTAGFSHPYAPVAYLPTAIPTATATTAPVPTMTSESQWVEHSSHDGRKYYYNVVTHQTTWEKPQELKTTRELILTNCPWKEFKSETGKPYYFNEHTKQSVWVKPQELTDAELQAEAAAVVPTTLDSKDISLPLLGTPCTPVTPKDDAGKPPEPSAIEKAMLATLGSFDVSTANNTDNIPIPPPPSTDVSSDVKVEKPVAEDSDRTYSSRNSRSSPAPMHEYKTRGEMAEGLRRLFRDCNVPGGATWEQALKLIVVDPRYSFLKNFSEKKQIFNVYKTQRLKEEKEEQRLRAKQAKEDLERFLLRHTKLHSTMSYRKVDQLLSDAREWTVVPDRDRRELFEDVMQLISKRERDEAKVLRKRNVKVFREILRGMLNLTFRTTWSEAQQMLLDNTKFTGDVELQSLDKEDALVCFEEHICMLEQEHDEERERERRRQKRLQRKNREAFIVLLDELHEQKLLTSTSMWKDLYSIISRDERFHKMLAQRGSTPLDLFKFYVEALKARYPAERKIVKEIIKDRNYVVDLSTTFEEFVERISKDERSKGIDEGNLRLSFESLLEKAQGRERERQRDDARRLRKLEQNFCEMLCSAKFIRPDTTWEEIRDRLENHPAFSDYLMSLDSAAAAAAAAAAADGEKSRRRKEKHHHKTEMVEASEQRKRVKDRKRVASSSPNPSEASANRQSDVDLGTTDASKRKHRKSKKSKRKKSKHHKHHKQSSSRRPGDEELEEGEAADDDDEEDDEAAAAEDRENRRSRKKHRRAQSSDPEDGEEVDSISEDEVYERESKRKRR